MLLDVGHDLPGYYTSIITIMWAVTLIYLHKEFALQTANQLW